VEFQEELILKEYEAIRSELRENKKFIFERAAIAVIGIVALLKFSSEPIVFILPSIAIGLVMYLLLFIANRFSSSAHMAAYISRFHEGDLKEDWFGWENYLDRFRRFQNDKSAKKIRLDIKEIFSNEIKSKYLFNYDRIYKFHKYIIFGFILISIYYAGYYGIQFFLIKDESTSNLNWFFLIIQGILICFNVIITKTFFTIQKDEIHPENVVTKIEYYRIVCEELLKYKPISNERAIKSGLLIILPCHGVYDQNTQKFYAEHPNDQPVYKDQIIHAFNLLNKYNRNNPLLIISGGYTKEQIKISESESYLDYAEDLGLKIQDNIVVEEYALVSIENLLFSIFKYHRLRKCYPEKIIIISWDFKKDRYNAALRAINEWSKLNARFLDCSVSTVGELEEELLQKVIEIERQYINSLTQGLPAYYQNSRTKQLISERDVYNTRKVIEQVYPDFPMPW